MSALANSQYLAAAGLAAPLQAAAAASLLPTPGAGVPAHGGSHQEGGAPLLPAQLQQLQFAPPLALAAPYPAPVPGLHAGGLPGMLPGMYATGASAADSDLLYVNQKQLAGILRRRSKREKMEEENKLLRVRKPFHSKSRHDIAVGRPRDSSGKFLSKAELAAQVGRQGVLADRADSRLQQEQQQDDQQADEQQHSMAAQQGLQADGGLHLQQQQQREVASQQQPGPQQQGQPPQHHQQQLSQDPEAALPLPPPQQQQSRALGEQPEQRARSSHRKKRGKAQVQRADLS